MLNVTRILGSALARTGLGVGFLALAASAAGCGQRGPLYLPTEPAATQRATLPQVLTPSLPGKDAPDANKPNDATGSTGASQQTPPATGAAR
jgi:predicted small lipoprotein YifL